jgi:predicted lipoprotein with Yx(FWY)xxD motif/plastocyanin
MIRIDLERPMDLSRRTLLTATGISIALAGCLGDEDDPDDRVPAEDDDDSDGDETDDLPAEAAESEDREAVTVHVRSHAEFGDLLVGPEEMTLYNFDADTQGESESACDDDCADAWPPLTVQDTPAAGENVTAELTTFERDDGTMQVAANGWPLYYFASDEEPGDTEGQGVNEVWWVLQPDGTPIRDDDPAEDDIDADATVTVGADGEFRFDPETLEIDPGETVDFIWEADGHNVAVADQPDEATWNGVADTQDEGYTHTHTFDIEGQYDYVCDPHEDAGMVGTVLVGNGGTVDGMSSNPSWTVEYWA